MTAPSQTTGPAAMMPEVDPVRAWVSERAAKLRALLPTVTASREAPVFGGASWQALPDTDPLRWVSALRAALAYFEDSDPHILAARLDQELEAVWRDHEADYDGYTDDAGEYHPGWRRLAERVRHMGSAKCPTHEELTRRRQLEQADA